MFDEEDIDMDEMDATKRDYVSMTQELGTQKLSKGDIDDLK